MTTVEYCVVLEHVQVLNHTGLSLLRFGLKTFSGPDSVHVQHLRCCVCLFHINRTSLNAQNVIDVTARIR